MRRYKLKLAIILAGFLLLSCFNIAAQQASPAHTLISGAAQGNLTVMATVVSSVGLVIGPDGQQKLVVANADPADSAASLSSLSTPAPAPAVSTKKTTKKR